MILSLRHTPHFALRSSSMAAESSATDKPERYAVVTGANKGIGFEICRQLASEGITVILTARNQERGIEALEKLKAFGLSNYLIFHQLDVGDVSSIASLAQFVKNQFGRLDILVNNAAILGVIVNRDVVNNWVQQAGKYHNWSEATIHSHELAEECLKINYYGAKAMIEEFIPLLQLSDSPRIVNVSSISGKLKFIPNNWAKTILNDAESLDKERVDEVLNEFLKDSKNGLLETKKWPSYISAYVLSKAAVNAYTRIIAKKYPSFIVNSVCPGYIKTDLTCHMGYGTVAEGAESVVRLALLPQGEPSGLFYSKNGVCPF